METRMEKYKEKRQEIMMDQQKHENLIKEIMRRVYVIKRIYKEQYPDSRYLSITIVGNSIYLNNEYWANDSNIPINVIEGGEE